MFNWFYFCLVTYRSYYSTFLVSFLSHLTLLLIIFNRSEFLFLFYLDLSICFGVPNHSDIVFWIVNTGDSGHFCISFSSWFFISSFTTGYWRFILVFLCGYLSSLNHLEFVLFRFLSVWFRVVSVWDRSIYVYIFWYFVSPCLWWNLYVSFIKLTFV